MANTGKATGGKTSGGDGDSGKATGGKTIAGDGSSGKAEGGKTIAGDGSSGKAYGGDTSVKQYGGEAETGTAICGRREVERRRWQDHRG